MILNGKTIADSLNAILLLEAKQMPIYYFPPQDVLSNILVESGERTSCPHKGEASYWNANVADHFVENAAWTYMQPRAPAGRIRDHIAFEWSKVDHWFEEDEEVFGHARDPYHRIDVRPSSREVRGVVANETVALTRRALFVFETGLPTRYYIPPADVRADLLVPSSTRSTCPYKESASYWSVHIGDRLAADAAWAYLDPLPECPRIKGHFCFYPEKVDRLQVEGDGSSHQ